MDVRSGRSRFAAALARWARALFRALPGRGGEAPARTGTAVPGGAPGAVPAAAPGARLGRTNGRPATGDGTRARHARLVRQPETVRIGRMNTLRGAH
ncbi:hypothetical protein [Streptomyces tsukubensis]|uniref:hypothetical protein n=1 Tax=Streptomyces tsukubensis TaxID=83656 RepID=UPI00344E3507